MNASNFRRPEALCSRLKNIFWRRKHWYQITSLLDSVIKGIISRLQSLTPPLDSLFSPVATPFAWTTPTSLPNTGPQSSLLGHMTSAGTVSSLDGSGVCPECSNKVSAAKKDEDRNKNVRRHIRERHGQSVKCPQCGQTFSRPSNMKRHITNTHE